MENPSSNFMGESSLIGVIARYVSRTLLEGFPNIPQPILLGGTYSNEHLGNDSYEVYKGFSFLWKLEMSS